MKKIIFIVLVLLIIGGIGSFFYFQNSGLNQETTQYQDQGKNQNQSQSQNIVSDRNQSQNNGYVNNNSKSSGNESVVSSYSMDDLKMHNSKESCWSAIRGKVYDLTNWVDRHPGGQEKILKICGKDGTELFVKQHGGKDKPENALKNFEIGVLK
jgi:cytochrome b involved in lipid metabolism